MTQGYDLSEIRHMSPRQHVVIPFHLIIFQVQGDQLGRSSGKLYFGLLSNYLPSLLGGGVSIQQQLHEMSCLSLKEVFFIIIFIKMEQRNVFNFQNCGYKR